jgi:c-di-GMP-binding flagellar brake protein YcgR
MSELKFFEIKEKRMVTKILSAAYSHHLPLTVWLKDQSLKYQASVHDFSAENGFLMITPPKAAKDFGVLQDHKERGLIDIFGTLQVDHLMIFLRSQIIGIAEMNLIQLKAPDTLFKLQRRASLRINVPRSYAPRVTFPMKDFDPKNLPTFRVLDLSSGGLAMAVIPEHADRFKSGLVIDSLSFKLRGRDIVVSGKVAHMKKTDNDFGKPIYKVGITFLNIKPKFEQMISQFVLDESRRAFSLLY